MIQAVLLAAVTLQSAPNVELIAPQARQVIQRDERDGADVEIIASAPRAIGRLVARASGASGKLGEATLEKTSESGERANFTARLRLPAGGWYALSLAVDGIAGPAEVARNDRVGVGEVFVVAGQSNSANFGEERFGSLDDRVSAFDGTRWTLAADPMPGVQDGSTGGSPWPVCGRALREMLGVPIAFASCGFGGTSLAQWQKSVGLERDDKHIALFETLAARVKAIGRFRAILWHQGESDADAGTTRDEYIERFMKLKGDLRAATNVDATWIVAHASFIPGFEPARLEAVRSAQAELWKRGVALRGPDTDALLGDLRHSQDKIHFSKAGLERHGSRWAAWIFAQLFG